MEEKQNKFLIPIAIIIAIILVAWSLFSSREKSGPTDNSIIANSPAETTEEKEQVQISVKESDHVLGNPEAKIILIVFSDFECPWCKEFHQTIRQIMKKYGKNGQVAWIFRQFPAKGESSWEKAVAAECVAQLSGDAKYWEFSDRLFTAITPENLVNTEQLSEIAEAIGLDKTEFANCLTKETTVALIKENFQSGIDAGIMGTAQDSGGTPYTIALTKSGKIFPMNGAQAYNLVKTMIDLILEEEK